MRLPWSCATRFSGGGFDLPPVCPFFEAYIRLHGLHDRLRFYPGNFFQDSLSAADVLVTSQILHGWNLEEKRLLLAKAYAVLPSGGALIVLDAMIDAHRRENVFGLLMSLNMLIESPGGFEYTGADCVGWMRDAGFRETRVEPVIGPHSAVIGIKYGDPIQSHRGTTRVFAAELHLEACCWPVAHDLSPRDSVAGTLGLRHDRKENTLTV